MRSTKRTTIALLSVMTCILAAIALPAGATALAGTGPDDALVPSNDWQPLGRGESHWYTFRYAGDGSQIQVRLEVEPKESAAFAVWTPEEIHRWRMGLEVEPIGRGSPDPSVEGNLLWTGNFGTGGSYYVVVERAGNEPGPGYYLLQITGDGVSLTAPGPSAAPEPKQARPQPSMADAPGKPTGKLVFQTSFGGGLYTINADGTGLRRITDGVDPIWSPDGKQIAFVRWRDPKGVWVVAVPEGTESDAGGSSVEPWRAFDWSETRWPSWSPDGTQILFSRQHGGRTGEVERCFWGFCFTFPPHPHWKLGIVRLADGEFSEPPASQFSLAPMWSPEGERIVYADEQGLRVQSEDEEVSYLITHDARDTSPAWSPDGQRVAFMRRQHDHWEVYAVDADGRNLQRLTDTPRKPNGEVGNSVAPAWSPDGAYVAFMTDRSGKWEMWIMRASGVQQKPMFPGVLDGLPLDYASVSERAISWTR